MELCDWFGHGLRNVGARRYCRKTQNKEIQVMKKCTPRSVAKYFCLNVPVKLYSLQ